MELTLKRTNYYSRTSIGELYLDGERLYYTAEDTIRGWGIKVYGETAIPAGDYIIKLSYSNKFKRILPMIYTEPNEYEIKKSGIGFKGVRFHRGNTHFDTHACILVGMDKNKDTILKSKIAEEDLVKRLKGISSEITLRIINLAQSK